MEELELNEGSDYGGKVAKTTQIIAFALMAGTVSFLAVVLAIRASGKTGLFDAEPWNVLPPKGVLSLIALSMAVTGVVLSLVVPRIMTAATRQASLKGSPKNAASGSRFYPIFQTQTIVGLALLEGCAFFNAIVLMVEGHIPNLVAVLVLIGLMAALLPSREKLDRFVEDQEALLAAERQSPEL